MNYAWMQLLKFEYNYNITGKYLQSNKLIRRHLAMLTMGNIRNIFFHQIQISQARVLEYINDDAFLLLVHYLFISIDCNAQALAYKVLQTKYSS